MNNATQTLTLVSFSAINKDGKLYNAVCSLGETAYGNPKLNFVPKELLPFLPIPHQLGSLDSMLEATKKAYEISTMGVRQSDVVRTETIEKPITKTENATERTQVLKALSDHGVKFSKNGKAIASSLSKVCRELEIPGPYNAVNRGRMIEAIVAHSPRVSETVPATATATDPMDELRAMILSQSKSVSELASSVASLKADLDAGGDY